MTEREISRQRLVPKLFPGSLVKRTLSAVQLGVARVCRAKFKWRAETASKVLKGAKAHVEKMAPPCALYKHCKCEERNNVGLHAICSRMR